MTANSKIGFQTAGPGRHSLLVEIGFDKIKNHKHLFQILLK